MRYTTMRDSTTSCRFTHDLLRQFFMTVDIDDQVGIHERLVECSRSLRPSDYDFRCLNALNAEQPSQAGALAVQAGLQRDREGENWQISSPQHVLGALDGHLRSVLELLIAARTAMLEARFQRCQDLLDSLPRGLPRSVAAEADYIRALGLMSTRNEEDHVAARECLAKWTTYVDEEPELGLRLMRLLLHGVAQLYDKDDARKLERSIQEKLSERAGFDPQAEDELYTLDRCAGIMYAPEVALIRIRAATKHFEGGEAQEVVRRPVEYYRCLVNLTATYVSLARYAEAATTYRQALDLFESFEGNIFPSPEYAHTNGLLAQYRLGSVSAGDALRRQREIVSRSNTNDDPFYVMNALAVYLTLNEVFDEAIAIYDGLDRQLLAQGSRPQASMRYMVRANRCATRFLSGAPRSLVLREWQSLTETVGQIAYTFRPYLERRHELLSDVIGSGILMSPQEFDECLVIDQPAEFGPLWANFGRGFRMPEIEIWRD